MFGDIVSVLFQILYFFNIIFGFIIVFQGRKNPTSTWAWLMVVFFIPYFGFIIYLIIGLDSKKHRVFAKKAKNDDETYKFILEKKYKGNDYVVDPHNDPYIKENCKIRYMEYLSNLLYLNAASGSGVITKNNEITTFFEGNEKFEKLLNDIDKAKSYIYILSYIMRNDELGNKVIAALAKKASEGVEVKLLLDGMGNRQNPMKFYQPLIDAGGQFTYFMPPRLIRVNYRMHRKISVIDGNIGYVGGFNIGDEYLGVTKRYGFWRDSHIRIVGEAVKELTTRFIMDWNYSSNKKIVLDNKYFPIIENINNKVPMQIVSSGPDTKWASIHYAYIKMISEAEKSIYIQTPYFAPDDSLFLALKIAALSGIDVRIIIPANPDHPFVYWSSLSFLGELLLAGVKCYEYERGFIHSKLIIIDGVLCSTGTANMDVRSFKLNFEINAFIYDRNITEKFEEQYLKDLADSHEITIEGYNKRSRITKIKESFSRLISPLL